MSVDLKAETPDATMAAGAVVFGADSQAAASPSVFTIAAVSAYLKTLLFPTTTVAGRLARYTDTSGTVGYTTGLFEDESGNVGIGTAAPASTLDVSGSIRFADASGVRGNGDWVMTSRNTFQEFMFGQTATPNRMALGSNGGTTYRLGLPSSGSIQWSSGSLITSGVVDAGLGRGGAGKIYVGNGTGGDYTGTLIAGNVGIGTTSPSNKFSCEGIVAAETDNAYTLGTASKRWTTVYATTGTINTSDARQKTDVTPGALGLDFVRLLKPVSYKWAAGGVDVSFEEEAYEERVPITETVSVVGSETVEVDGKWIKRATTRDEAQPVYDTVPLYDEAGNPVTAADGTPILHRVPRMQTVTRTRQGKKIETPRPGKRTHYGLLAQDVKAALDTVGVTDFAGWILTDPSNPESEQGLRPDQLIPVLIKAVQDLAAQVDALKASATP